ncbi:carbonic anhydrase [Anabaena sp. CA = ATCC 33047]|uniref:carbonic anhydrase n=1 Tax=Anabaena sp. (strain CA / ATCC 33047) TaxID=52271 RepID=UPI0008333ACF|nr:carbonic anhydrase [Anabaena sp. CA = ATCC 33047]
MYRRHLLKCLGASALGSAIAYSRSFPASATTLDQIHWGYIGAASPEHWGELSPDFQLCQTGRQQTPINLEDTTVTEAEALIFNYRPTPLKIIHNGHSIQVNYAPGSAMTFKGESFNLVQFHFHHPSEHQITGQPFDLEIHLVHRSQAGKLAVVGIFAQTGTFNPVLQSIWDVMPIQPQPEQITANTSINVSQLLPSDRSFYEYRGSLTTPPCSEDVLWFVMQQPIEASKQQIQQFAALFPHNSRPLQPLNSRTVLHSS